MLMNSAPLSESTPRIGNGILSAMLSRAARTHLAYLVGARGRQILTDQRASRQACRVIKRSDRNY